MKNSIILIAAVVLLCVSFDTCIAQDTQPTIQVLTVPQTQPAPQVILVAPEVLAAPARFGIKGGLNLSNLDTRNAINNQMITGFNVGLFSKLPFSRAFAIQPELYYTTKGAAVTYRDVFVDGTARFNLNYLELPVLLVFNPLDFFNIHVGPYVSYLLNGSVKNESGINLFDFENNINVDDYNRFDVGLAAGIGVDLGNLSIGARYNLGFTKVGKERMFLGNSFTFPDATNGVFNIYLSLSL